MVTLNPVPAVSTNATPEFSGKADTREGNSRQVTLKIYSGEVRIGTPVRTLHAEETEGRWKIGPIAALGDGTYTAQAEQQDDAGHAGQSLPVTFTIDAAPPKPTLVPLAKRINNPTPTLQGTRSTEPLDEAAITVTVYEGSAVGGGVVGSPQTFSVSGASWSYSVPHLNDGTYTAQASQRNAAPGLATVST